MEKAKRKSQSWIAGESSRRKMTLTTDEKPEAETPLLNDVVPGSVDFRNRPSIRSKSGCWKSAPFIIVFGVAERFAYYGISSNSVSYLTGKLGQSTASAASSLNAWYGVSALLPILGASVADSFSGRFRMILFAGVLYIVGLGSLTLSASLNSHSSSKCKSTAANSTCSPDQIHILFYFFSMYLIALAQGGFLPCVQAFGADQFDEEDKKESEAKSSFFNWWYFAWNAGAMVLVVALNYVQENVGWELGFGIPAIFMFLSLIVFLVRTTTYRFHTYTGKNNPFVRIYRVFVRAAKNWQVVAPVVIAVEEEGSQFKFLDKALITPDGLIQEETICSIGDVEDTKSIIRLFPFWCACLGYSIIYAQPSTLFTKQAATVDRHITSTFQVPAASLQQCFVASTILVSIPIYDRIFVPAASAITKNPTGITKLQRIGTGLVLSLISIVFAALVEMKRLATARQYGLVDMPTAIVPMNVWWLAPQYVLAGIADVFAMIGLQEFFYDQVPSELRSIGLALYMSILGVGSLISSFLVSFVQNATKGNGQGGWFSDNINRAHIDYFYWLLAVLGAFGLAAFIYCSKSYIYRRQIISA